MLLLGHEEQLRGRGHVLHPNGDGGMRGLLWGREAHQAQASGEPESTVASRIFQNTGFILHRENARAIVRRSAGPAVAVSSVLASAADLASAHAEEATA